MLLWYEVSRCHYDTWSKWLIKTMKSIKLKCLPRSMCLVFIWSFNFNQVILRVPKVLHQFIQIVKDLSGSSSSLTQLATPQKLTINDKGDNHHWTESIRVPIRMKLNRLIPLNWIYRLWVQSLPFTKKPFTVAFDNFFIGSIETPNPR